MKKQSDGRGGHWFGFRLRQHRSDALGIAGEATPPGWTNSAATVDGAKRGTGGDGTSIVARVCRFTVIFALALPAAVGATTGVAYAGTTMAATTGPLTGSYSGYESQNGNGMKFYVSADRKSLQDVVFPAVNMVCTPGNTGLGENLAFASVAISPTGSFSATATRGGVVYGSPAVFTYAFRGDFNGVTASGAERASGTYAETVRYNNSTTRLCTSKSQTWVASRDTQPAQPTSAPPTGSYSGYESQNGNGMKFYVSADRKSLQDVVFPAVNMDCTPGNTGLGENLAFAAVAISPTGSFSATATQVGVVYGSPAVFTYAFRGNFHGVAASGAERAAGTYAETVRYSNSAARTCTSNVQWWYAARDTQPAQPTSAPPTGSYSGYESQNGNGMKFYVSADRKSLQDVVFPAVNMDCAPGNTGLGENLAFASVAISPTGSFSATATQVGVVYGSPAVFTYAFRGNFHGVAASGAERAAGTYAETVRYSNSAARTCTSNVQWWYTARDAQPAQPTSAPPTGSYSGYESQNGNGMKFYVSADRKSLQNVFFPAVNMDCTPGNTGLGESLSIPAVAINPTGSFSATVTRTGKVGSFSAVFTYTFRGNFHGVAASGAERAAGTYAETVRYADSAAHTCMSNTQWWYASWT